MNIIKSICRLGDIIAATLRCYSQARCAYFITSMQLLLLNKIVPLTADLIILAAGSEITTGSDEIGIDVA